METTYKKGTKLWDKYFQVVVVVEETGIRPNDGYIQGRYYYVRYASGVANASHESAFELYKNQRPRDAKGHYKRVDLPETAIN